MPYSVHLFFYLFDLKEEEYNKKRVLEMLDEVHQEVQVRADDLDQVPDAKPVSFPEPEVETDLDLETETEVEPDTEAEQEAELPLPPPPPILEPDPETETETETEVRQYKWNFLT